MREILVRGKRLDNGEWVEGYLLKECNYATCSWNLAIEYKTDRFGKFAYDVAEVDPETLGQYTGLCDKNGKKIFEGDIIEIRNHVYCCCWDEGNLEFILINEKESIGMGYAASSRMNVIGNVYDNPKDRR